ncbi:aminodeoxychorismate synthase component I [Aquirufa sp. ROCK-SH2]
MKPEIPFISFEQLYPQLDEWGISGQAFVCLIDFKGENAWAGNLVVAEHLGIKFAFDHSLPKKKSANYSFDKHPIDFESYQNKFLQVQKELKRGNSFLVNLTAETPISCNLTLEQIFEHADANYKLHIPETLVVFSPECFIKIDENHQISSFPMKGTKTVTDTSKEELIADEKEQAEHATIVDLIRNDLSKVAFPVKVEKYKYIDSIKTHEGNLHQMSSAIQGEVLPELKGKIGSILKQLLPAGSISGAPKDQTLKIIEEIENYDRGFYTGILGYFDGKKFDSGVLIRFIEKKGEQLIFKSGGGITVFSEAEKEYKELIQKVYLPF